jgi:hypothetical protein
LAAWYWWTVSVIIDILSGVLWLTYEEEEMGWSDWFSDGTGEAQTEKVTVRPDGSVKYESLRTNDGSKGDHQHVWIDKDSSGKVTGGGATPGKKKYR